MKLLVIGGTKFVGRHFVEAALAAGYEITLLNRQETNSQLFPHLEKIKFDRKLAKCPSELQGRSWDAVIDTCAHTGSDLIFLEEIKNSIRQY